MTGRVSFADKNPTTADPNTNCWDMPGMGQQDLITGFYNADATKTKKNEVTGCFITQVCFDPHQKIDPVYFWNNVWLWNGGGNGLKIANYHPNLIRENVHYFDEKGPKPGYTEYVYPHPLVSGSTPPPQPTTPSAPTMLMTTSGSSTTATLSWLDTSSNELGFIVERCTGAGCSNFAEVNRPGVNAV